MSVLLPLVINGKFGDVPAITGADIGKALAVNGGGTGFTYSAFATSAEVASAVAAHEAAGDPHTQYVLESAYTAADVLSKLLTVDGAGSGIDADFLDGNSSAAFALASHTHGGGGTPGGSDTQVQFNDGGAFGGDAGLVYNKTTDVLTGTGRFVFPKWSPASDSTTALQVTKADGTTALVTVNTTNSRIGIGTVAPARVLHTDGDAVRFDRSGQYFEINPNFALANTHAAFDAQRAMTFYVNASSIEAMRIAITGYIGIGVTAPTALLDLAASTTARAPQRIRDGTLPTAPNDGDIAKATGFNFWGIDAGTNAIANMMLANRQSSGTPAAGFGAGFAVQLESSTTIDQIAGRLTYEWIVATHASRASRGKLSAYSTSTEQEAVRWDGDSGGVKLGFYGTAAVAQQVLATGAGATVDQVITALQNLGLVKQS